MSGQRTNIKYIERQTENLTIDSMRFLGLKANLSNIALPRQAPVTRTSTLYPGRPDRALCNISRGNEIGRQIPAHSPRKDGSQNQTRLKPRNFVKPSTYDGSGMWNDYLSHFESVCLLNGLRQRRGCILLRV